MTVSQGAQKRREGDQAGTLAAEEADQHSPDFEGIDIEDDEQRGGGVKVPPGRDRPGRVSCHIRVFDKTEIN